MNTDRIREFVMLSDEIKEKEDEVEVLKAQRAKLQAAIVEDFAQEGIDSVRMDGRKVYLRRDLRANVLSEKVEDAAKAFRLAGYGDMVRDSINANTLSAFVRENEGRLPASIEPFVSVYEQFSIRIVKG